MWWWNLICEILSLLLFSLKATFESIVELILPPKDCNLCGEVAIVTGAGHGIGRELALQLSQEGVKVACWDINETSVKETQKLIEDQNGTSWAFKCDVSDRKEVIRVSNLTRYNLFEQYLILLPCWIFIHTLGLIGKAMSSYLIRNIFMISFQMSPMTLKVMATI